MKILYHHRTLGDGAEGIHIAEMVNAFRELGHEVKIVSLIGSETNKPTSKTRFWGTIRNRLPDSFYELTQILYNITEYFKLNKCIKQYKPDLIYKRHANYDAAPILVARHNNVPIILEVNRLYSQGGTAYFEPPNFPQLAKKFEVWICSNADKVIVVSTPMKDELLHIGVPKEKIIVMPNGANPGKFKPLDSFLIKKNYNLDGKTVLGFVGILWKWHGVELLLEVFSEIQHQVENLHLLIIGDGPIQSSLEEFVRKNSLQNHVTFTGRVSHNEVVQYIAAMDIAILPAERRAHASPMKILEYMAMEKPTIAPKMRNIEDIITDGEDGILFEPENKQALKMAILSLVYDKKLREKIGKKAREKVLIEYNWINNSKKVLQMYERLVNYS
jgi:glycosyltransferase involved in cell wall biosynthesis